MNVPRQPLTNDIVEEALTSSAFRRILAATINQPASVKEICRISGLPMASAYRNIKAMEEKGLLVIERSAITTDGKPYDLYRARIDQAALRLGATGVEISWRVNGPIEDRLLGLWNRLGA